MSSDVGARNEARPLSVSAVTARPGSRRGRGLERLDSGRLEPVDQEAGSRGERGADLLGARRELRQHAPERLARNPHHDRVLGRARADAARGRSVERALADERAGADPALAFRLRSVLEQRDRARMDEIPEVGGLAGEEERFARSSGAAFPRRRR